MSEDYKSRYNWLATLLLCIFLGTFGVHRFYVGKFGTGLLMLLTAGGFGIWYVVDIILIATGAMRDVDGNLIKE
ncbi:MAG: TM2 domain-containing protein [Candidatus Zophobacter franzmannii]|jgi:TM2 domain-containing membrane protein YozV|nr:TM2 domain-containing protein [Candidatus Zophobacter franzmannii]